MIEAARGGLRLYRIPHIGRMMHTTQATRVVARSGLRAFAFGFAVTVVNIYMYWIFADAIFCGYFHFR